MNIAIIVSTLSRRSAVVSTSPAPLMATRSSSADVTAAPISSGPFTSSTSGSSGIGLPCKAIPSERREKAEAHVFVVLRLAAALVRVLARLRELVDETQDAFLAPLLQREQ